MPTPSPVVVLDANVLYPISLCDTLLRCALAGLYHPLWSTEILGEVARNLVADGRATPEQAERRAMHMQQAFPHASVSGYEGIVPTLRNDEKDRHVLAAAIRGRAQIIVTQNLADFPAAELVRYSLQAQHPAHFLQALLAQDALVTLQSIHGQRAALRNPPMTLDQVLAALTLHVPGFIAQIRGMLQGDAME